MKFLLIVALSIGVALASSKIDSKLATNLKAKKLANVMVNFVGGNEKVVGAIETRSFKTRGERLTTLKQNLEANAASSQGTVLSYLKSKFIAHQSFWISNQVYIQGADLELVEKLASFPEISEIHEERIISLDTPVNGKVEKREPITPLNEWGIEIIEAPAAWEITNGSGVVVANIDTGVRYTHEALRESFKGGNYAWYDPYQKSSMPNDQNGHGTHTMGTTVGTKGIGVAPGAKWIACKGCATSSCTESALTQCGEWAACPSKPDGSDADCSQAPVLVSNSWGGGRGDKWYEPITEAWIAGGIIPLFSIGNSGPSCGTANSPGDIRRVIGVGSTDSSDAISYFSSVGPAADGRIKPEISAPGSNVRSAVPDSDTAYGSKSGTSMACPHAAGVTALLLAANPNLTFGQVRQILIEGVDTNVSTSGTECGGITDTQFPNHIFGYGRINALKVVQAAKAY